jgi:hypothetical protein
MSADGTWSAALALLAQPGVWAQAAAPTGLFTDMPAELDELTPNRMVGKTALDVVVPDDRVPVIESWEVAREQAVTSLVVRLVEPADHPTVRLTFLDLRKRLGIYLCVHVPTQEAVERAAPAPEPASAGPVLPRFARVLKSQLARFTEVDDATTQLLAGPARSWWDSARWSSCTLTTDELGHEAGDRLLVTVADALRRACRASDALGRIGGDEFLVVCGDLGEQEAGAVRERLVPRSSGPA